MNAQAMSGEAAGQGGGFADVALEEGLILGRRRARGLEGKDRPDGRGRQVRG